MSRSFPNRDAAQEYVDAVNDAPDAAPCKYGHLGCALRSGGPCSDEIAGLYRLGEDADETRHALRNWTRHSGGTPK